MVITMEKNSIEPSVVFPKKIKLKEGFLNKKESGRKVFWFLFMRYFVSQWAPEDEKKRQLWLRERGVIFEKYCLPTIFPQLKESNGKCFLFVSKGYEVFFPDKLKSLIEEGFFEIVYGDLISETIDSSISIVEEKRRMLGSEDILVLTRLDNDDALSKDYYEVCCNIIDVASDNINGKTITFPHGVQYHEPSDEWYSYLFTNNHFLSFFLGKKSSGNLKGFFGNHSKLFVNDKNCLVFLTKFPMWTEVVHGGNIANRMQSDFNINRRISNRFF